MNEVIPPTENSPSRPISSPAWRNPWIYVAVAALGLAGWQWGETRVRLAETREEVAKHLAENAAADQADRNQLRQAQELMQGLQAKLGALETRQAEFQGQTQELQSVYQDLARSRDEATLLEVEQAVTLAAQQLQLAGNVQVAVLALQTADAKLARLDRPQFLSLRKILARDLERLRSLPFVDLPGMSMKLEGVLIGIDKLPLAMHERPAPAEKKGAEAAAASELPWWRQAGDRFLQDIKGLVRIQRLERSEPVLLAPEQAFFLRENIKLRLLNARLALFARDAWTFRNELKTAQEWLGRHFDSQDKAVQAAQVNLRQLSAAELNIELPNLNDSLSALRTVRNGKERK